MNTKEILKIIVEDIHTSIIATVEDNKPITCAIDLMDYDDNHIYFLTAKGKNFYNRLKNNPYLAFTCLKGEDTMSSIAISFQGEVKEVGSDYLPRLFKKNPYMYDIYPTEVSREALTVFSIYKGTGEYFDLSTKPITRFSFSLNTDIKQEGYMITDNCIGCQTCLSVCPQNCIDHTNIPFTIQQEHCLHCGNCYKICPIKAIERL